MPKIFYLGWVIVLGITRLEAQVRKDTVREHIDYRQGTTFSTSQYGTGRMYTQYLGIQANQFLQLISNNKADNKSLRNPYDFIYTINQTRTGYGIELGFGYESSQDKTTKALSSKMEAATSKASLRIGFDKEKIFRLRWIVSVGIDLLLSQEKSITQIYQNGFIEETNHKTMGYGLGPRATLQYRIWSKISLGTEVCWYFEKYGTNTREKFTGLPAEHFESSSTSRSILLPVSIFISARIL